MQLVQAGVARTVILFQQGMAHTACNGERRNNDDAVSITLDYLNLLRGLYYPVTDLEWL
jgi:hypothetical protein